MKRLMEAMSEGKLGTRDLASLTGRQEQQIRQVLAGKAPDDESREVILDIVDGLGRLVGQESSR